MRMTIIAVLAACIGCLLAQNPADDPGGWSNAKWGMTQNDINTAFPGANFSSYRIGGRKYSVMFVFKDAQLNGVRLRFEKALINEQGTEIPLLKPQPPAPAPLSKSSSKQERKDAAAASAQAATTAIVNAEVNEMVVTGEKESLLSDLTEKYGNPTTHSVKQDGNLHEFEWLFPTTKITLMWFHSQFKQLDSLELFYTPRTKSSEL